MKHIVESVEDMYHARQPTGEVIVDEVINILRHYKLIYPEDVALLMDVKVRDLRAAWFMLTGTRLAVIEFAVSHDACLGIDLVEDAQHLVQSNHLLGSAIVLVFRLGIARVTTFVADADAVRIVALHMATTLSDRSTIEEGAIASHINMIAGIGPVALGAMTAHQLLDGEVLIGTRVRTVEHKQVNLPR